MSDDMQAPIVSVQGEAILEVEAEIARLVVTVNARDKNRETATRALRERGDAVLEVVKSFGDAIEQVATTALRVHPWYREGRPSERIDGYVAQLTNTVTVRSFEVLGDLSIALVRVGNVDLMGPTWGLRPNTDARAVARRQAVDDALARATDYAAALGSRVTGLVELADGQGTAFGPVPMARRRAGIFKAGGEPEDDSEAFTLEPQRQTVRAFVQASFTITPPAFDG
jgi:uncharacterized protein YggE